MKRRPTVLTHAGAPLDPVPDPGRRRVLKLMAASAALAGSGCSRPPPEKILPYVDMPEGMVPGDPVFYASTLTRAGQGIGVLVETESGRPIKIEGNPNHPASRGAADAQAQAAILTLWDPERSRTVMRGTQPSTWTALLASLSARLQEAETASGEGLALLTGPVSSPTLLSQIGAILARFPGARWHVHDPTDCDARAAAARQVFGTPAQTVYRLDRARVILSADADLFGPGPDGIANARDFMVARRQTPRARLISLESSPNLCGAQADSRIAMSPIDMEAMLEQWAVWLAREARPGQAPDRGGDLYRQLTAARGASVVAAGPSLSPRAHLLVWKINVLLGNVGRTVYAIEAESAPVVSTSSADAREAATDRGHRTPDRGSVPATRGTAGRNVLPGNLVELTEAMRAGAIRTLAMVDVNPVYDAPGGLGFAQAMRQVPYSVHMGLYRDETAHQAHWHVPMAHELEAWSDALAFTGDAGIVQPVIEPLHGGRSAHELLSVLVTGETTSPHRLVRRTWRERWQMQDGPAFEARWAQALMQGISSTADQLQSLQPAAGAFDPGDPAFAPSPSDGAADGTEVLAVFVNDSSLVAGAYANNAWLQELPRPFTKMTWDNAALMSPATAKSLGLHRGDVVVLSGAETSARVLAPVWIMRGQVDGVITLPLGYGRPHAGSTARGHGFDAFPLQDVRHGLIRRARRLTVTRTEERHAFSCTQEEMQSRDRGMFEVHEAQRDKPEPSLYPKPESPAYAWGMTVDLDACIGCNACIVACQSENNIPVVGPDQVAMGRAMHWLRVDLYHEEEDHPAQFQPMACQHCENAPCEVVCPVGATMHDSEGLNVQVYNRCVGTRFCSNNCPYKVRHFNFFQYSKNDPSSAAHANPDVTVRQRGVMEKCTYCVQRISHARIEAEKAGRPIRDGEVVTACQATCPTNAIVFGDTNDPNSQVSKNKRQTRNFTALGELNTKPRTSYLARIVDSSRDEEDGNG